MTGLDHLTIETVLNVLLNSLDLAKALGSVFAANVRSFGIIDNILIWLMEFLIVHHPKVVINGWFSSWLSVTSMVPQGSVF